jgi:hypothetical protein
MGLLRKITRPFKKVAKKIRKIIPKEVKPFAPYIAAGFVPAGGAFGLNQGLARFLTAGATRGLVDEDADFGDVAKTGVLAALPNIIEGGANRLQAKFPGKFEPAQYQKIGPAPKAVPTGSQTFDIPMQSTTGGIESASFDTEGVIENLISPEKFTESTISKVAGKVGDAAGKLTGDLGIMDAAKYAGTGGSIDVIGEQVKLQEELLDDQGITDKSDRRQQLFDYFTKIEYGDEDEINSLLDRYGYKGFAGGGIATLRPMYAEGGGIMDLGGNEMDLRVGGFVPIGKKEKADDVPARLSKNEFVMTADAVRGAGGGNINVGAKRMYDMMNQYEMMA